MSEAELSGWGHYPRVRCNQKIPRTFEDVMAMVANESQLIARGAGRAYGDAALNPHSTLLTRRLDHMLAFDPTTGALTCESGVMLSDILATFIPRGWFPPVTPGTQYVTLGGMLAADVHGKNHHIAGSFSNYVDAFDLVIADGSIKTCTRLQNADLFAATCGGMGLTGIILRLTFRLIRIETAYIRRKTLRAAHLDEVMEQFEAAAASTYSVAWIDCLANGANLGRSVFYTGEHAKAEECKHILPKRLLAYSEPKRITIPPFFPSFTLGRWSVRAFNALFYLLSRSQTDIIHCRRFFFPLDMLHHWNRLYGSKGFVQYQCVLPKETSKHGLQQLLTAIAKAGSGSFLAVLKLLGKQNGLLSFPMEGYTLAMDFPAGRSTFPLFDQLDAIVADHGGRIYLAKDARTTQAYIEQGFPGLEFFKVVRNNWKAAPKFSSLLSERLGL